MWRLAASGVNVRQRIRSGIALSDFPGGPIFPGMNPRHQAVNTRLARRRPLRVMLAHNLRRVAENIRDTLKAGTVAEKFCRQRVPEPMRMCMWHHRQLERLCETALGNPLRRRLGAVTIYGFLQFGG